MKEYCLYAHINKFNDKVYIGITKNINYRWSRNDFYYKGCTHFKRAIDLYGWDNFIHVVLIDGLTKEEAIKKEKMWIKFYKSEPDKCYNLSDGGDGVTGVEHPDKRHTVYKFDLNGNFVDKFDGVLNAVKSITTDNSQIKRIKNGICRCCEARKTSYKRFIWSYTNNISDIIGRVKNRVLIYKYDKNNNLIKIYNGYKELREDYYNGVRNICQCMNGKKKSAYGFKWIKKIYI